MKLFKKLNEVYPKCRIQENKNYASFSLGGAFVYELRIQQNVIRILASNYPAKASFVECFKIIKQYKIEGKSINGNKIIYEAGVRSADKFTLRIEIPYKKSYLTNNEFIDSVIDSLDKFHNVLLPLVNHFLTDAIGTLSELMSESKSGKKSNSSVAKKSIQAQIADTICKKYKDAVIKKVDKDNYLDIHLPFINEKRGTHLGINTAKDIIRMVFYCRDADFVQTVISQSNKLEEYSQGIRPLGDPSYTDTEEAIKAIFDFISELKGGRNKENTSSSEEEMSLDEILHELGYDDLVTQVIDSESQEGIGEKDEFRLAVEAYQRGDFEYVARYVERGNPTLQFNGDSLITVELISLVASRDPNIPKIQELIARGIDINERNSDDDGYTAVHFAAWDGKNEILKILISHGADLNIEGLTDGKTPLHLAATTGHTEAVETLILNGADIEARDTCSQNPLNPKKGATPLRNAVADQQWDVISILIEHGADVNVLTEPCILGYRKEVNLERVIHLLAQDNANFLGEYSKEKLEDLFHQITFVNQLDEAYAQTLESSFDLNKLSAEEIESADSNQATSISEENDDEIEQEQLAEVEKEGLRVLDLQNKFIKKICEEISKNKYLTNLLYINQILDAKGYQVDNHQAYFFDSSVLFSDQELEGFLMVNMDGFYSNCMNEDEMEMVFSWSGVNDLKYYEIGTDSYIDLIADQGELTIKKENTHSLKVLYTFYHNVWKLVNDKFIDEPMIIWNEVWDMGINEISFKNSKSYFEFKLED